MNFIPLARPDINENHIQAVADVLRTGMLVQGKQVEAFEKSISKITNSLESIAVSNGTSTLHLALVALGIGEGDEVIVPAFSYVATVNVVEIVKARPVFVDIDLSTFNIDTTKIEAAITSRTKAIIPVHEFGLACNIDEVIDIAKRHNLAVIEDAACALGAKFNGKHVGTFGDFGSFSFHPRKAVSSGEGGMVTTQNAELARKIRILRNHGIELLDGKMEFVAAGFNYRMTDFQAALVNSQLSGFDSILQKKEHIASKYSSQIRNAKVTLPSVPAGQNHTWQTYHLMIDDSINRDHLIEHFRQRGIGVNYGAQCLPAQKYYKEKYNLNYKDLFKNSYKAYNQGLAIPLYERLTEEETDHIIKEINLIQ